MDELLNLSHHPSSLIQQCDMGISYYNGSASECQDLRSFGGTPFISLRNGVCYSFNFRGVSHPRGEIREAITSSYPGSSYGLRLVIKLEGELGEEKIFLTFLKLENAHFQDRCTWETLWLEEKEPTLCCNTPEGLPQFKTRAFWSNLGLRRT